jgi:glycosyltransferase involved in cell wall biosynthesis
MKIAQVVSTFPPVQGGMGYVCLYNARELARRGHDVTVFTVDYGGLDCRDDYREFNVVRIGSSIIHGDAALVPRLYSMLRGFDVIHLHYPFFGGAEYVYLAALARGQKYLLTYHMDVYGNTILKKLVLALYEPFLLGRTIRRATAVCALSNEHIRESRASRHLDRDRLIVLPNGVDTEKFRPRDKSSKLISEYGLEGKTVVLFVGNLQYFKGLHLLIEALSGINDSDVMLLVVGGGYEEAKLKRLVNARHMGERVVFAGPKSHDEELPLYYGLADFLVLPSTRSESFGLAALEAMASGIPVIVSSLPGPSRLVDEGRDGLVTRAGDTADLREKIGQLLYDRERRLAMGGAAREKAVEKYDWRKIGDRLEKIIVGLGDTQKA